MQDESYALVPLRNRAKEVIAWTKVDTNCEAWVNRWTWCRDSTTGYVVRSQRASERTDGKKHRLYLHRELLRLTRGDGIVVDHRDGDRLNNTLANLLAGDHSSNMQNRHYGYGTSKYRGVSWVKKDRKWTASANEGGKRTHLGYYESQEEAAAAAFAYRATHMPFSRN